jgi:hypothetical protein
MSAAGVTRLAIAGCTEAEIATITGHSLRDLNEKARLHHAARRRGGGGRHRLYNVDISSKNFSAQRFLDWVLPGGQNQRSPGDGTGAEPAPTVAENALTRC